MRASGWKRAGRAAGAVAMLALACATCAAQGASAAKKKPASPGSPPDAALSQYMARVRAEKAAETLTPGSIWTPTGRLTNLVSDVKAVRAHDPIAVVVSENSLDQLAYAVASQMNTQNAAGSDLNGNPGAAIFGLPAGASAADPTGTAAGLSVVMTDPSQIAAAATGAGSSDSTNAIAMADIADEAIVNGTTPAQDFSDFVTTLGSLVSEVSTENTAQQSALTQLQNQVGSLSGVSLNDEAASLETLEQSYEAASKLFTSLDEVMTSALNLGVETTYT